MLQKGIFRITQSIDINNLFLKTFSKPGVHKQRVYYINCVDLQQQNFFLLPQLELSVSHSEGPGLSVENWPINKKNQEEGQKGHIPCTLLNRARTRHSYRYNFIDVVYKNAYTNVLRKSGTITPKGNEKK